MRSIGDSGLNYLCSHPFLNLITLRKALFIYSILSFKNHDSLLPFPNAFNPANIYLQFFVQKNNLKNLKILQSKIKFYFKRERIN